MSSWSVTRQNFSPVAWRCKGCSDGHHVLGKTQNKRKKIIVISPQKFISLTCILWCFALMVHKRLSWSFFALHEPPSTPPPPAHTHFTSSLISCLYHPLYHPHPLPTHNLLTTRRSDSTGGGEGEKRKRKEDKREREKEGAAKKKIRNRQVGEKERRDKIQKRVEKLSKNERRRVEG